MIHTALATRRDLSRPPREITLSKTFQALECHSGPDPNSGMAESSDGCSSRQDEENEPETRLASDDVRWCGSAEGLQKAIADSYADIEIGHS